MSKDSWPHTGQPQLLTETKHERVRWLNTECSANAEKAQGLGLF